MESAAELRRCDVVRVVEEAINSIQICVAVYIVRQSVHQLSIKSLNLPEQPIGYEEFFYFSVSDSYVCKYVG